MIKEKMIQGVGLYGEFVSPTNAVYQVIFIPDGYNSENEFVLATIMTRTLTQYSPKKQWRIRYAKGSKMTTQEVETDLIKLSFHLDPVEVETFAWDRLEYFVSALTNLLDTGYKLRGQPILFEVSKKDLDAVAKRTTPTKVIYRIGQSRDALGFPKEILNGVAV
jgi:hypothetical protein